MSHVRFYRAILSRARYSRSVRRCCLVLVGCLAQRKRTMNRRVQKKLDMERFHHFGTVLVKEDRETGKAVQKPCLFMRRSRSVQLDSRAVRDRVAR